MLSMQEFWYCACTRHFIPPLELLSKLATSSDVKALPAGSAEQPEAISVHQMTCANVGILKKVFQNKGFGFIAPVDGSQDVFLHFREILGGDARDLVVGTEFHFNLFIDESGMRKAKNVTVARSQEVETYPATERPTNVACQRYSRQTLLGAFETLFKEDSLLESSPGLPKWISMPRYDPQQKGTSFYEEDPDLNDEHCVIKLEARLSHESGADANNIDTFGDSVKGGWSFEQALDANSKVGQLQFGLQSGDSTPTAAADAASECEY